MATTLRLRRYGDSARARSTHRPMRPYPLMATRKGRDMAASGRSAGMAGFRGSARGTIAGDDVAGIVSQERFDVVAHLADHRPDGCLAGPGHVRGQDEIRKVQQPHEGMVRRGRLLGRDVE